LFEAAPDFKKREIINIDHVGRYLSYPAGTGSPLIIIKGMKLKGDLHIGMDKSDISR
jgi:hypothetical protein